MMQQLPHCHAEPGEPAGSACQADRPDESALLDEHQDAEAGELLSATRQVEDRVLRDRAAADVGEPIASRMDDGRDLTMASASPGLSGGI